MRMFLFALLLLAGCTDSASPLVEAAPASVCRVERFEDDRFTVCVAGSGRIELFGAGPDGLPFRRFAVLAQALGKRANDVLFAMNAGMFDEEGKPIGLHIEHGREMKAINRARALAIST